MRDRSITCNADRLFETIRDVARFGAKADGGCCRLSLSDEDKQARDLFVQWAVEAGCEVRVDAFGNIFCTRKGTSGEGQTVLTGSHLDTQPNGGNLDGIFGVLAGLEVIRSLNDHKIQTEKDVTVVNWTNEEGSRFVPGLTGSSGFIGGIAASQLDSIQDSKGASFASELARIGYAGSDLPPVNDVAAYIEAHIEQGPVLEHEDKAIGVVTGIQGVRWFEVDFSGADRHAGTTPMNLRRDSFMAAADFTCKFHAICIAWDPLIRFTVGRVCVSPGSPNTVPGNTSITVDLRHPESSVLDDLESSIDQLLAQMRKTWSIETSIRRTMVVPPAVFNQECISAVKAAATYLNKPNMHLTSGAMHDASRVSSIAPTGMIFVPSREGISHHGDEFTEPAHLADGCDVLLHTVLALAGSF